MKKIITMFMMLIFIFTGCDNNEGPFEVRMEEGKKILYSGNKPAKGWVQNTIYNTRTNARVVVYEIYFENGIPAGDFKLYDREGKLAISGEGKWKENIFKGTVEERFDNGKGKGNFRINPNFLVSYNGNNYLEFSHATLIDGKYNGDKYVFERKNNKYNGKYLEYLVFSDKKRLLCDIDYKDGKYHGKYLGYYLMTGHLNYDIDYKDGEYHGKYLRYIDSEKGSYLVKEVNYKEGKKHGKYIEYSAGKEKRILEEIDYKNDKLDGRFLKYDFDGNIILDIKYKDGIEVKEDEKEEIIKDNYDDYTVKYYSSGRVSYLSDSYIEVFPEDKNNIKEIEKDINALEENIGKEEYRGEAINSLIDFSSELEYRIIAEKLNKNITETDKKEIKELEKKAKEVFLKLEKELEKTIKEL